MYWTFLKRKGFYFIAFNKLNNSYYFSFLE